MPLKPSFVSALLTAAFMTLSTLSLSASEITAPSNSSIEITNFYARATPPNAVNSALFATITNNSKQIRTLVSASSSAAAKVELHDVIHEGDVMKMRQVAQIEIPAEQTVMLKPGSLHIMLLNINKPFNDGESIEVTLTYANGDVQELIVPVKKVMAGMRKHHH